MARQRIRTCLAETGFDTGGRMASSACARTAIRARQENWGGGAAAGFLAKAGLDALLAACEAGPRTRCAGKAGGLACWMEVDGRPGGLVKADPAA